MTIGDAPNVGEDAGDGNDAGDIQGTLLHSPTQTTNDVTPNERVLSGKRSPQFDGLDLGLNIALNFDTSRFTLTDRNVQTDQENSLASRAAETPDEGLLHEKPSLQLGPDGSPNGNDALLDGSYALVKTLTGVGDGPSLSDPNKGGSISRRQLGSDTATGVQGKVRRAAEDNPNFLDDVGLGGRFDGKDFI